jgi:hypothetical protein
MWLLLHHTGATGWPKAGWSDARHMAALQATSSGMGKTWEYNYVITHPEGWIWEQAGEFQSAHCLNANSFAYGVQINQADSAGHPPQNIVDSFRWLRAHLVETGQLHPNHQLVPHYGLRTTSCSANDLSDPPQGRRPGSPTGQGSLGSVHPAFAVPWNQPPPPPPPPPPGPPGPQHTGVDVSTLHQCLDGTPAQNGAVFAWNGQQLAWVTSQTQINVGRITGLYVVGGSTGAPLTNFGAAELQDFISRGAYAGKVVPPGWTPGPGMVPFGQTPT